MQADPSPARTSSDTTTSPESKSTSPYSAPKGVSLTSKIRIGKRDLNYDTIADWMVIRLTEKPVAELFYTSYTSGTDRRRPVTFLFNGGPGAASAYLHMGAVGPKRVVFAPQGEVPAPPVDLQDNVETWLSTTDLVFVDPIGTGFSRTVRESRNESEPLNLDDKKDGKGPEPEPWKDFFAINRDLDVIVEFVSRYLSKYGRWESPIFIAGESYGGFRVGKLARRLQEGGIAVNGAILISPALDLNLLDGSDYNVLPWIVTMPTMALAALHHRRARRFRAKTTIHEAAASAERFACEQFAELLIKGDALSGSRYSRFLNDLSDLIGIDRSFVELHGGRVPIWKFSRELLREQRQVCGLYDATITGDDPFPDREGFPGPDPTMSGASAAYRAGINAHLRSGLGVQTDRQYNLFNDTAWRFWKHDSDRHVFEFQLECVDDLRYGLAVNPTMRVLIAHGHYDLVTPYFASKRLIGCMKLTDAARRRVDLENYHGGHMFYMWDQSRREFFKNVSSFFERSVRAR